MNNKKKWVISGDNYSYGEIPGVESKLPVGVYQLEFNPMAGYSLTRLSDDFLLPEKVYESERTLVDRVIKTFNGFNKNFGILLKGLKGTGKTITGKQICNELKLPVILVNNHYPNMGSFINSIGQDIIMFFDEFEKTYEFSSYSEADEEENPNNSKKGIGNLLTLMDGVFTSDYKRLFVLTTNKEYMPDAIMSRPSRIRYTKDFTDITYDSIMEILNDVVKNKELIPGLLVVMRDLEILTVDIVKSIAEEANLYDTADMEFFSIFNVKREKPLMDLYVVKPDNTEELVSETFGTSIGDLYIGKTMRIGEVVIQVNKIDYDEGSFVGTDITVNKSKLSVLVGDDDLAGEVISKTKSKVKVATYIYKKRVATHRNLEKVVF